MYSNRIRFLVSTIASTRQVWEGKRQSKRCAFSIFEHRAFGLDVENPRGDLWNWITHMFCAVHQHNLQPCCPQAILWLCCRLICSLGSLDKRYKNTGSLGWLAKPHAILFCTVGATKNILHQVGRRSRCTAKDTVSAAFWTWRRFAACTHKPQAVGLVEGWTSGWSKIQIATVNVFDFYIIDHSFLECTGKCTISVEVLVPSL